MHPTIHVCVCGASRHRLPRGTSAERPSTMPRGLRTAGRVGGLPHAPDLAAYPHQTRGAGNPTLRSKTQLPITQDKR